MNQPNDRRRVSRRLFLRGVGVTMALPWLESLPSWGRRGPGANRLRSGLRRCSWGVVSTRNNGGRRAMVPRWSWGDV